MEQGNILRDNSEKKKNKTKQKQEKSVKNTLKLWTTENLKKSQNNKETKYTVPYIQGYKGTYIGSGCILFSSFVCHIDV